MKLFDGMLFRRTARAAAVGAALLMTASASHAQSAPFAGLNGAWSGTGTVTLANGANERIRCRAHYAVGGGGHNLRQSLRCASDSYKFDLSSNVIAEGGRVSGEWSEATRGINGELRGRAGGGDVEVFVEASGFAANLTVSTRGNKQLITISSKGEIRGVSITMVKGG